MYDDELKKSISSYMRRIDENVFVAGMVTDENGFEEYLDLSEYEVLIPKNGDEAAKHVKYTDYFNVESPVDKPAEDIVPKEDYDSGKLYLNHGHCIFTISVELLERIGKPKFFNIRWNEEQLSVILKAEDEMKENIFDILEKVYDGQWKGIHVFGGDFGVMLLKLMGIRNRRHLLEVTPIVDEEKRHIGFFLDEVKKSGAELEYNEYLLPQWQYDELWADEDFEDDFDEEE